MGPLDLLTRPLRAVLGIGEQAQADLARHSPLAETQSLRAELGEAVAAVHRAADSMERHVAVVETLAQSVPALTDSVNRLVAELNGLLGVLAPMAAVEREVSRAEHFFRLRRREQPPS